MRARYGGSAIPFLIRSQLHQARATQEGLRAAHAREATGALISERGLVLCYPLLWECRRDSGHPRVTSVGPLRSHSAAPAKEGKRVGSSGLNESGRCLRADDVLRQWSGATRETQKAGRPPSLDIGQTSPPVAQMCFLRCRIHLERTEPSGNRPSCSLSRRHSCASGLLTRTHRNPRDTATTLLSAHHPSIAGIVSYQRAARKCISRSVRRPHIPKCVHFPHLS